MRQMRCVRCVRPICWGEGCSAGCSLACCVLFHCSCSCFCSCSGSVLARACQPVHRARLLAVLCKHGAARTQGGCTPPLMFSLRGRQDENDGTTKQHVTPCSPSSDLPMIADHQMAPAAQEPPNPGATTRTEPGAPRAQLKVQPCAFWGSRTMHSAAREWLGARRSCRVVSARQTR